MSRSNRDGPFTRKEKQPFNYMLWCGKDAVLKGDWVPALNAMYLNTDPDNKAWFWIGPDNVNFLTVDALKQFGLEYRPDPCKGYSDAPAKD